MAEGGGFEPPEAFTSTVFKTVAIVRSASPPQKTVPVWRGRSTLLSPRMFWFTQALFGV